MTNFKVAGGGIAFSLLLITLAFVAFPTLPVSAATTPVALGTAAPFAVLASSGITNTGTTTITGDVGSYPTPSETGFGTVTIAGTNYPAGAPSTTQTDLSAAIGQANGYTPITIPTVLDSQALNAGVYTSTSTTFTLSGTLILNGQGNSGSVWIFQAPSTATSLVTGAATGARIILEDGADSCNVFWVLGGTGTLGTGTTFVGTIMAGASITLGTGTTIQGAALASTGDVTMNGNGISTTCITAPIITTSPTAPSVSKCPYVSGFYTNSTTDQVVYFYSIPWAVAYQLVSDNGPSGIFGGCASPATTTTTTTVTTNTTATTNTTTTTTTITPPSCYYLTIDSVTSDGANLTGEYTDIWNASQSTGSGLTPTTFCIAPNTVETVGVFDSANTMFAHWLDSGSALRFRQFSISSNTTFTAVYTNTSTPTLPNDSVISVNTVNTSNNPIAGYYSTLWQNGTLVQSCFSPCAFTVNNGHTYQVAVADSGIYVFDHWTSGSTDRFQTVVVGDTTSTISLVAVYAIDPAASPMMPRTLGQMLAIQVLPSTGIHSSVAATVAGIGMVAALASLIAFATIRRSKTRPDLTR